MYRRLNQWRTSLRILFAKALDLHKLFIGPNYSEDHVTSLESVQDFYDFHTYDFNFKDF